MGYLPRSQTITGQYYDDLFKNLREQIKDKRRGILAKGALLLHDNSHVFINGVSKATIKEYCYELIQYVPYSPDLAPSHYYLYRNLKEDIRGKHFKTKEEVESWFGSKSEDFFSK